MSRPQTCPGFAATLDTFGFDVNDSAALATQHDDDRANHYAPHPVFEAMTIHLQQCPHCAGISEPEAAVKVAKPRFGRVA